MYPEEQCDLFHRTEDEVKAVRQVFGLTENSIREGVDAILEWFHKQPHLAHIEISRPIVEMMLIIGKGSIERAKEKIDNFYRLRSLQPEIIQNRKEILCSSHKIWGTHHVITLPKLQDNRRIFIIKFGSDFKKFDPTQFYRRTCLLLDLRMTYDYMAGDIWIVDYMHVGWARLLTLNPLVINKMVQLFTKALNWRIYGIHCINVTYGTTIIQRIINFSKQYITSVIMDRIVIHNNVQELYKYVPKECLPEDYGGNELSCDKLAEIAENEYRKPKITKYLLECSKMVSNESLRPRDENSEEFLAGFFRKLEVD